MKKKDEPLNLAGFNIRDSRICPYFLCLKMQHHAIACNMALWYNGIVEKSKSKEIKRLGEYAEGRIFIRPFRIFRQGGEIIMQSIEVKCLIERSWSIAKREWVGREVSGTLIDITTQSAEDNSGKLIAAGVISLSNGTFVCVPMEFITKLK